ncbi:MULTISPECIES: hypothetical protein [unclassified Nocardiopsis]|uniref:hypothetical protein n=1 Tax=unclassified Nocardiopsis TaxID=2649073 RepID=UPI001357995F|nr:MULTISPECIES: hypothetical protein [unclassified Nocardiopsis]
MKFDIVEPGPDEPAAPAQPVPDDPPAREPVPPSALRLRRASEYMHLRARTDLTRVRSALNQMLHTVEADRAEPSTPEEPEHFRPGAFRSRTDRRTP